MIWLIFFILGCLLFLASLIMFLRYRHLELLMVMLFVFGIILTIPSLILLTYYNVIHLNGKLTQTHYQQIKREVRVFKIMDKNKNEEYYLFNQNRLVKKIHRYNRLLEDVNFRSKWLSPIIGNYENLPRLPLHDLMIK